MRYEVDADIYEGPLPLLVELARLNLIDLFLVKLVDLTQDYLSRIRSSGMDPTTRQDGGMNLNELAEPLPLLGNLMAIKARHLIPSPPVAEEEEVPVSLQELERRLKEYEQFKTVAQLLSELHVLQRQHFTRPRTVPSDPDGAETASSSPAPFPIETGITDLVSAFSRVLEQSTASVYEVTAETWTVEMKIQELRVQLFVKRRITFSELFTTRQTTLELVVTFLALLELIRTQIAHAMQEQSFAEILIVLHDSVKGRDAGQGAQ